MLLCVSMMVLARAGSAQEEVRPLEPDWLQQMYADGWEKVQEGILRRDVGEGRFETFGYGAEGLQWLAENYRQQLTYFEGKYRESPSDELASLIDGLMDKINSLQGDATAAPAAESFSGEQIQGCSFSYDATVAAGPQTSAQGVTASASAYFQSTCPETTGNTYAYAYAHATGGTQATTMTQEDPQNNGTAINSVASASVNGSGECESIARASVDIPSLNIFYAPPEASNYLCPDQVSISGPNQVTTDYYGQACADVTWTASVSSGRTDYTFEWYIGTTLYGTGPTLTKRYCNEDKNETVQVVARDGATLVDDATFTTSIQYAPAVAASLSGPATVTTDYYSSPCATVTWTAGSTGGHPGYTYQWSIGTDPTVLGTGSTFSKQFCPTASQAVTVKAVAQDSDGHTAEKTYTTNIVYTPALAVSVDGPPTATVDYYGATCATVTWTATPTNGHPGYTYAWYINYDPKRSNTVQGTGSTLTKSYCTTSQSYDAMVVATDSDGHTATSATFTTNFTYKRQIVPTITGPATVSTNTTTPCADVTWTAGATGTGHSPFTYKWYFGTTLQGSGSTLTKRYCSTSATVNVKLVATGSDGHSANTTFTTTITYTSTPPPLTASISGPTDVYLYGTTCETVTWTSTVGGGTPAYSYSWTIGTSTTVLSTSSSLTRTVCTGGTLNVKLTVRDSASQSKSATFNTTVTKDTMTCMMAVCP